MSVICVIPGRIKTLHYINQFAYFSSRIIVDSTTGKADFALDLLLVSFNRLAEKTNTPAVRMDDVQDRL